MVDPMWLKETGEVLPRPGAAKNQRKAGPAGSQSVSAGKHAGGAGTLFKGDDEQIARGVNISDFVSANVTSEQGKMRWNEYLLCLEWAPPDGRGGVGPWQVAKTPFLDLVGKYLPEDVGDGGPLALQNYLTPDVMKKRNQLRVVRTIL